MNGKTHGSAPDLEKANDFLARLRQDGDLQKRLAANPSAALSELGLDTAGRDLGAPVVLGSGDRMDVIFVRPVDGSAETNDPDWPWRTYLLSNRTDRALNLETWRLGSQEYALKVPPESALGFQVATLGELIGNVCNLLKGSHLVRDLTNDKVLAESFNVTCGRFYNRWTATGSGGSIALQEVHD